MSTIEIKNLSFGYDELTDLLFDHVTLNLATDWRLGLIGRNGRGKTTFLKLLQGQLPYQGQITAPQKFVYFPQTIAQTQRLTHEVITDQTAIETWQIERELNQMATTSDLLWRRYCDLSGGEQTKVCLALLFADQDNFPLIDEPTNHLDIKARQQVADYLRHQKRGFIVISHDRAFIDSTCDHILAIDKHKIDLHQGNFSTHEQQKNQTDQFEQQQDEKLKREIARLKQTAMQKATWSKTREQDKFGDRHVKGSGSVPDRGFIGARAARTMKRSKHLAQRMDQEITAKEGLRQNIEQIDQLGMNFSPSHHKQILTIKDLQLSYDQHPLFEPISLNLARNTQIGLIGSNGAGKSSIIQAILHRFPGQQSGDLALDIPQDTISFVRQNYESNQGLLADFAEQNSLNYQLFLNNLHKLGLPRAAFTIPIEKMSMGQRKKVELAKSLAEPASLYLWDEPLNYLDVFNQDQLIKLLQAVKPTLLVIEHDQHFIDAVTNTQLLLKKVN